LSVELAKRCATRGRRVLTLLGRKPNAAGYFVGTGRWETFVMFALRLFLRGRCPRESSLEHARCADEAIAASPLFALSATAMPFHLSRILRTIKKYDSG
jgi:hypothetical protein